MANRQALRELQTRLADRLQAARTNTSQGASWLAVQVAGHNYLPPLEQAGETSSAWRAARAPYQHMVLGRCQFAGQFGRRGGSGVRTWATPSNAPSSLCRK